MNLEWLTHDNIYTFIETAQTYVVGLQLITLTIIVGYYYNVVEKVKKFITGE